MARVFVSYASKDPVLACEVHGWLVEAGHEVFLDQDPRDGIAVGELWRTRLVERLRWADAVVCVVTSSYLASTWCAAEVAIAQERGSRLLPLHAEPDLAHPLLTDVQHTDLTRDPVAARAALIAALRRIDAAGGSGWPDDRSPFPGLRSFDVDRHRVFFGRVEETKALTELVRSAAEDAVLLVVGPSGCGKSSLVRAGLLPALADEPGWRTLTPILPGADPVAALARELAAAARRIGQNWTVEHVHQQLDTRGLTALAGELLVADPDGPQRRLLVVIDQFEELLTQTPPGQRARFAQLLRPALAGPVQVGATLRPEFLNQLLINAELADLPTHTYTVRPLHREALRLVIEGPARLAGLDVEEHLVARLVGDTDTGEALPLLAFTLAQLADGVGRGGQLSATRYDQLGGVQGALTRQADAALTAAVAAGGRSREQVIAGLLRLVTVDEDDSPTRWRVNRAELPEQVVTELDAFVAQRLLTTDTDNGTVIIGVAHEAFLSAWLPLAKAIAANVTALRARRAVEHAATERHDDGRSPARLWDGGQLAAVVADTGARIRAGSGSPPQQEGPKRWLPHRHRELVTDSVDLSPKARKFLHDSIRRDRFRRRRATTILSVLLILALIGAGVAVNEQRNAQERQRIAIAGGLILQADATRDIDPRTALRIGIAAERIHPGGEAQASLVATLSSTPYAYTLASYSESASGVAFSHDGRILATGRHNGTVVLYDMTNRALPRPLGQPLTGYNGRVRSLAFAPDRDILAAGGDNGTAILWDVTNRAQSHPLGQPLPGLTGVVESVAFAPNGHTLATGSGDGTVTLWDVTDPAQPHRLGKPLTGYNGRVLSVAFAPHGDILATGGDQGIVILWDVTNPAQPHHLSRPLTTITGAVESVAFAPDGHTLATGSEDSSVILWDLTHHAQPHRLGWPLIVDRATGVFSMTFSPDGGTLATGYSDGTVILRDVTVRAQPRRLGQPLNRQNKRVGSLAFSPDGSTLATASYDGTVVLWDLAILAPTKLFGQPLADHTLPVQSAAFAPGEKILATAGEDKTVILWDITNSTHPRPLGPPLPGHTDYVWSVAFAPNGKTLATAGKDSTVILWDISNPSQPHPLGLPLTGHNSGVRSVAFAPDGDTLATASEDNTVILWDVREPAQPRRLDPPLTGHIAPVYSVAFAPRGHTLASASLDAKVILWDLTNRAQPRHLGTPFTGHAGAVRGVAFSPDGTTLATGSVDRAVILWDISNPAQPRPLGTPLTGHNGPVHSVAFAPDGHTLATASEDKNVILWDISNPAQPRHLGTPLIDHTGPVHSVAFTGSTLATASYDMTVALWDLNDLYNLRAHVMEHACSIAGRGLNRDEWNRYIPGLPYQETCPA